MGVPFDDSLVNVAELCVQVNLRSVKNANILNIVECNRTGSSLTGNRCILIKFVRPQIEYGLGLTYVGKSFEKVLNKFSK